MIWLAWVLGAQLGNDAVARLAASLLLVALALWAWQTMRIGRRARLGRRGDREPCRRVDRRLAGGRGRDDRKREAAATGESGPWQDYTPQRVAQLVGAGRPVFVDFTAAWCVTCQVNKRLVLNTDAVQQAFVQGNVALVRADWTRRDPVIGAALAALGRDGVPVYVLYRPDKAPLLLSELLSKQESAGRDRHAAIGLRPKRPGRRRAAHAASRWRFPGPAVCLPQATNDPRETTMPTVRSLCRTSLRSAR